MKFDSQLYEDAVPGKTPRWRYAESELDLRSDQPACKIYTSATVGLILANQCASRFGKRTTFSGIATARL